jgi:hypothetical protein
MKIRTSSRRAPVAGRLVALVALAGLATGCGSSHLPDAGEPDQARQAVTQALDAWKAGSRPDGLATAASPLRVLDNDWAAGATLVAYRLVGDPMPLGQSHQQSVELDLKDARTGKPLTRSINYTVTAGSPTVLARQDIDD